MEGDGYQHASGIPYGIFINAYHRVGVNVNIIASQKHIYNTINQILLTDASARIFMNNTRILYTWKYSHLLNFVQMPF